MQRREVSFSDLLCEAIVEVVRRLRDSVQCACPGAGWNDEGRTRVPRIFIVACKAVRLELVGDPLDALARDPQTLGDARDRPCSLRDHAEELPSCLGLSVSARDRLTAAAKLPRRLEDVGDDESEAPRPVRFLLCHIDNILPL